MKALNKQALREAANAANIASWGQWESYKSHKGARGYEVKVGAKAVAQHCLKVDSAFIAAANPPTVLALLDENLQLQRDKDSLEAVSIAMRDDMREAREKLEVAEKRNAELEGLALENIRLKVGISGLIGLGLRYADADVMRLAADAQQSTPTTDGIIENIAAGIGMKGE